MKTVPTILYAVFALACLAVAVSAQAITPAPDGGYPGGNTAEGQNALLSLATGGYNTGVGFFSLRSDITGNFNTAIGAGTLLLNTGDSNTAVGATALLSNTIGQENTAAGANALFSNTEGSANTASGFLVLSSNTTGSNNTADGEGALGANTTGSTNTAIGVAALYFNTTGSGNIALGRVAGRGVTMANNVIAIGADGADVSDSCYIGNIAGQTVGAGGTTCYVDNDGKLGVFLSARRFKTDIADMGNASEALLALRPVTFHYKPELDKMGIPQFGLVAEEVAAVNPDLVTHNARGELNTVRYEAVNAMLLNEFLKEHRKVESQEAAITQLKAAAERQAATTAQQREQIKAIAAGLQKVTAQIETIRPAPQIVLSNHL
jgi:Chaperone of endosialidase